MIIVHSDKMGFTNLNNVCEVKLMGKYIRAHCSDGDSHAIARYDTEERAEYVFRHIIECYRAFKDTDAVELPKE